MFHRINTTVPSLEELSRSYPEVRPGGHWQPARCRQRQRIAVLIPLRQRWHQLPVLVKYLHLILALQWRHYTIYVVEQNGERRRPRSSVVIVRNRR